MGAFGHWLIPTTYEVRIIEQDEETRQYESLSVTSRKVKHIELSRGYRVSANGKSVAISGDTDYCEGMIELGKDADLMILECAWPDDLKTKGHLGPTLAWQLAQEANCKKLCLTHFYPPCDLDEIRRDCSGHYHGDIVLAEDLMSFDL
jgi:ribonuclease BN (tRNA processing enzyme)